MLPEIILSQTGQATSQDNLPDIKRGNWSHLQGLDSSTYPQKMMTQSIEKIPELSTFFVQCNLNLMVAFHSVTMQHIGTWRFEGKGKIGRPF